mgnify:CR=1 FL=1
MNWFTVFLSFLTKKKKFHQNIIQPKQSLFVCLPLSLFLNKKIFHQFVDIAVNQSKDRNLLQNKHLLLTLKTSSIKQINQKKPINQSIRTSHTGRSYGVYVCSKKNRSNSNVFFRTFLCSNSNVSTKKTFELHMRCLRISNDFRCYHQRFRFCNLNFYF